MTALAYIVAYWIMFALGLNGLMILVFFALAIKGIISNH